MNTRTAPFTTSLPAGAPAAARQLLRLLPSLKVGVLDLQFPDGSGARFGTPAAGEPQAALRLHDWSVCSAALRSGDIGFAESFIAGHWSSPDLVALLKLLLANRDALERVIFGSWWGSLLYRARHLLNRNSRRGSRKNIHAHYDIGNAFYRLWLDETMNYSSALFEGDTTRTMAEAQRAKVRRALREVQLQPGQRLLEIGCGWGALAECAAGEFDASVVGVTLSDEQLAFARERLQRQQLDTRTDLRLQDYRDVDDGPFDAVVSIEMFEAVGREYWGDFFATLRRQLKPGGLACIQSITIRDDLFERYVRSTDFIQQYIFPGGLLPSASAFRTEAQRAGLEVVNALAFGADYAETLKRWRADFLARDSQLRQLGFDTRFMRIWDFYLAYCEAAFATDNTSVVQFTLRRP
ncbi:MAG: cyclopropane-fatty-acyl-phospholipid synthase family protein [Rubrivivax sp.]|nr:cyclopropane-fatty-acyl-phospholipid synthase family protein [Rubrivivax sp.]